MNHTQRSAPSTLSLAVTTLPCAALDIISTSTPAIPRIVEGMLFGPGPIPCRCGRYLSEDFDGRLFCRGCQESDPSDITSRLPLCQRPR